MGKFQKDKLEKLGISWKGRGYSKYTKENKWKNRINNFSMELFKVNSGKVCIRPQLL